jgi:hypothetical protein
MRRAPFFAAAVLILANVSLVVILVATLLVAIITAVRRTIIRDRVAAAQTPDPPVPSGRKNDGPRCRDDRV